ncbi:hypothetical protein C9374_011202 [Naegleria lovaniensis]|uniref:Uncharacterized protein n=1 Tax=Naegleria lovaniensis TaxID=51637 RepID=A0AA88GFA4_NAELO|nr:uncharacterized protein C9374_011202 [Naegleria lovaniensis]KAG2374123.1 hypothetical protein C9374_011202 [Naegleria lovaniensis]
MIRAISKITPLSFESNNKHLAQALKVIGQQQDTKKSIQTEIIGCTLTVQCDHDQLGGVNQVMCNMYEKFQDLKSWHEWSSPLHSKAHYHSNTETSTFSIGTKFSQDLNLGFPIGSKTSQECITDLIISETQCTIQWSKQEGGLSSCHIWSFDCLSSTHLQITNVEVFHGIPMVLVRPLVSKRWNQLFEKSLEGFVKQFLSVSEE